MSRSRAYRLAAAIMLAGVLAFALRDTVETMIILPAARLWWAARILWRAVPQQLIWIMASILVVFTLLDGALARPGEARRETLAPKKVRGPVETMASWIRRSRRGVYMKWLVANRLGRLAHQIELQNGGGSSRAGFAGVAEAERGMSSEVAEYLTVGLRGSFADYSPPRFPWQRREATPLDLDPEAALRVLEGQLGEGA